MRVMGITRWLVDETAGGLDVEHTREAQMRRVSAKLLLMNVDFLKLDVGITAQLPAVANKPKLVDVPLAKLHAGA
jgi:hypothetical protein